MASGQEPILRECEKPTQAWNWQPADRPDDLEGIDIFEEGGDELATTEELSTPF
jgi:hypothetical protein